MSISRAIMLSNARLASAESRSPICGPTMTCEPTVVATADFKCNEGRWEIYEEVQKEYEAQWVAENETALDAWKARQESSG